MDDHRFDALAKRVGTSRRGFLKRVVGLGGAATVVRLSAGESEAARRGYGGQPSPGPSQNARICTLSGCCMDCDLWPWTSVDTIRRRYQNCVYTQGHSCDYCLEYAVSDVEGHCQAG